MAYGINGIGIENGVAGKSKKMVAKAVAAKNKWRHGESKANGESSEMAYNGGVSGSV
jgi:hypothetical protein